KVSAGGWSVKLDGPTLASLATDLRTLLRERLAALGADCRARVLEFLTTAAREGAGAADAVRLAKELHQAPEALRERFSRCMVARERPRCIPVGSLLGVEERSFFVGGWMRDEEAALARLTAVSPEGCRAELLERVYRYARPDLDHFFGSGSHGPSGTKPG